MIDVDATSCVLFCSDLIDVVGLKITPSTVRQGSVARKEVIRTTTSESQT